MRKIPTRNYIIALFLSIATVALVLFLMNLYNNRDSKLGFITEVKVEELENYTVERNELFVYVSSGKKDMHLTKQFKKYLKDKEMKDYIVYIDINDDENLVQKFNKKYNSSYTFEDPSLILIEEGKIKDHIENIQDFDQIKEFIEGNNIK